MINTHELNTDEWKFLCDVAKEVCGFKDGEEIGHYPTYWYPPREWSQDPIHKGNWNPLRSLEQAREVWLWAKRLTNSDYAFDFETVTPTKVCEESLRVVRNARWCGTVNTLPSGDGCYVWRCICASPGGIRLNKGCDMCEYEEIADND